MGIDMRYDGDGWRYTHPSLQIRLDFWIEQASKGKHSKAFWFGIGLDGYMYIINNGHSNGVYLHALRTFSLRRGGDVGDSVPGGGLGGLR